MDLRDTGIDRVEGRIDQILAFELGFGERYGEFMSLRSLALTVLKRLRAGFRLLTRAVPFLLPFEPNLDFSLFGS